MKTAFNILKVNCYEFDRFSNLRVLELIEKRVEEAVGKSDLENVLIRQQEVLKKIDDIAYKLYGVEEYREIITQALTNIN
ncbi:hypothetical protein ACN4EE_08715 [Geminocystis sp. CENA526]|uniref:hypothetical protein n=1 Tax=Geminocystis sp. CENA526 TaxID=1355871 RepID=UPI003D6F10EE